MTPITTISHDNAVRDARRELKQAERALQRAERGSKLASLAMERVEAATVRFISLTGHGACRGRYLETPEEHLRHTRPTAH
jgi:hypothetical protein